LSAISKLLWPEERAAARPPEHLTVSQWADRYRILPPDSAVPGPWSTDLNPPTRGIMDAFSDRAIRSMTLMGGTQWGKSETLINCGLWAIDQDPAPIAFVMPTEKQVVSFAHRRLKQAVASSPRTRPMLPKRKGDWKADEFTINGASVLMAWAESASRLAERSIRYVFADEIDKMKEFTGKEADPLSLITERTRWWHDYKHVFASTPTTPRGYIWGYWLRSDRRRFFVPCIHCGTFQPLEFSKTHVVWPETERDPEKIRKQRLARYVCQTCTKQIEDTDENRHRMLRGGVWVPEGGKVLHDGTVAGPFTEHAGFHLNCLYSPVLTWSDCAAMFLRSKDNVAGLLNWTNSWLGWPWIEKSLELEKDKLAQRAVHAMPRGVYPKGAVVLTAGADVGKNLIHYVITAWMPGERTHCVEAGVVTTLDELTLVLLMRTFEDVDKQPLPVRLVCIDSGYDTDKVYGWCMQFPELARPTKGFDTRAVPYMATKIERDFGGTPGGLMLWSIDTSYYKDKLARQMTGDFGAAGSWSIHENPPDPVLEHLTSEHKVLHRDSKGRVKEVWMPKPDGGPNHWFDAAVYSFAAGDMLHTYTLREHAPAESIAAFSAAVGAATRTDETKRRAESWIRKRDEERETRRGGFIRRRGPS
jgi:phage terminase large subunit GpA-like protein